MLLLRFVCTQQAKLAFLLQQHGTENRCSYPRWREGYHSPLVPILMARLFDPEFDPRSASDNFKKFNLETAGECENGDITNNA